MNKNFREVVKAIRDEYPDISEDEATKLVIEYVESNLPHLLSQINVQAYKKREKLRLDIHSRAKMGIKSKKLQDAGSKENVAHALMELHEYYLNKGLIEEANTITSHLTKIEEASVNLTSALMYADADISNAISRKKKDEEDTGRALRELELLGEDSSD